jgi:2-methylcitrate dehydratase PrpD
VAKLGNLDAVKAAHAIGIAASQAGGLVANFGSMTKPFHAGRAAQVGVLSARLAAAGMTAAADALENKQGLLNAISPGGDVDLARPLCIGEKWWLISDGLGFKLYPMCYGTHRAIDGTIVLAQEHNLAPENVVEINVEVAKSQLANLVQHDPQTALDAKFSMEFALAMAIIARRATLTEVEDSFVQRSDVRALMKKVRISILQESDPARHRIPPVDGVRVTLVDGRTVEQRFRQPLGHRDRPVGPDVLWAKFLDCTHSVLGMPSAQRLFGLLQNLEQVTSVTDLPTIPSDNSIWPDSCREAESLRH